MLVKFDVYDGTTGEVLAEGLSRIEAIRWAAAWADDNGYCGISIDDIDSSVIVTI